MSNAEAHDTLAAMDEARILYPKAVEILLDDDAPFDVRMAVAEKVPDWVLRAVNDFVLDDTIAIYNRIRQRLIDAGVPAPELEEVY